MNNIEDLRIELQYCQDQYRVAKDNLELCKESLEDAQIKFRVGEVGRIIRDATKSHLQDTITRQMVGDWFHKMKVSVDVLDRIYDSLGGFFVDSLLTIAESEG